MAGAETMIAEEMDTTGQEELENSMDFAIEEKMLMPVFKKSHISTRAIQHYLATGDLDSYSEENNKRNALRQAAGLFRLVKGELFRHGSDREYKKYGLRIVVHDDEPQKKLDVLAKCHVEEEGNHLGMNNTIKRVTELYYWQGVSAHVKIFLKKCGVCKTRSKLDTETWLIQEKIMLTKKKERTTMCYEAKKEVKNLGRIKKPTPPETFFIVNAERKVEMDKLTDETEMMIDSNNIEYVVETLGYSEEGCDLPEVCHVFNVPDIVPIPNRFRSREIETFLKKGTYPDDFTSNQKAGLRGPAAQYTIIDEELYHEGNKKGSKGLRQVVHDDQPALKVKIMVECHLDEDGTHLGLNRTMTRVSEKYFWVGLSMDVRKFLMRCKVCMLTRGKKMTSDNDRYSDEVAQLKNKHREKHGDISTVEEVYEGLEEVTEEVSQQVDDKTGEGYGHQIIRLVGPNEDVTEITVAVVNGDFQAEGITEEQFAALTASNSIQAESIQTVSADVAEAMIAGEVTEEEVVEHGEIVETTIEEEVRQDIEEMSGEVEQEVEAQSVEQEVVEQGAEHVQIEEDENTIEEASAEETSAVEAAIGMIINKTEQEKDATSDLAQVDGHETQIENDSNTIVISMDPEAVNNTELSADKLAEEAPSQEPPEQADVEIVNPASKTGLFSFYDDIIYVPKSHKTQAMQLFLESRIQSPGYTWNQLTESTKNLFVEDGVLYRRPSRYKGRQIVVADSNPEMKLKIIAESHLKADGRHFSEVLTLQIVQYKYYWEEVKWDVHRFYLKCSKCVKDGQDVRLKRKVLSVEEQKRHDRLNRQTCANAPGGMTKSARRNREFREEHHEKLEKFRLWSKYGKKDAGEIEAAMEEKMDEITEQEEALAEENLDGTTVVRVPSVVRPEAPPDEESDLEINMPGSDEEDADKSSGIPKPSEPGDEMFSELFSMVLYANLEQEEAMRQLFAARHWHYELDGMKKFLEDMESSDDGAGGDGYDPRRSVVYEMTMKVKLEQEAAVRKMFMENDWQYSLEELEPCEAEHTSDEPEQTEDTPASPIAAPSRMSTRQMKKEPETPSSPPPTVGRLSPHQAAAPSTVTAATTPKRKSIMVDPEWEEESISKGRKRAAEVASPPVETRRSSRREIKKPRRYSPDVEIVKVEKCAVTPKLKKVKIEPVDDSDKEIADTPKTRLQSRSRTRSTSDKEITDTPKTTQSVGKTRRESTREKVSTPATVSAQKEDSTSGKVSTPATSRTVTRSKAVKVEVKLEEQAEDDVEDTNQDDKNEMFIAECEDDDDLDDVDDDDDDEDDGDEEENKNLDIFEDAEWPLDETEIKTFQKKSLINVCSKCGRVFKKSQQSEFETHVSNHKKGSSYSCDTCSKQFLDLQCLDVHKRVHSEVGQESCVVCAMDFHTSFQQAAHMYRVHGESAMFSCDICRAKFVNIKFLKSEMLVDGQLSFFRCVMCSR